MSRKFLSWNQLKLIALIAMTIDHIAVILPIQNILYLTVQMPLSVSFYIWEAMRMFGRSAFPIYAFGIAQGCRLSSHRKAYLFRLLALSLISMIPHCLAFDHGVIRFSLDDVCFLLFIGAMGCTLIQYFISKSRLSISVLICIVFSVVTEMFQIGGYGGIGFICIIATYLLYSKRTISLLSLGTILTILYLLKISTFDMLNTMVFLSNALGVWIGITLLLLYDGSNGKTNRKNFFYIYYPSHLTILWLIHIFLQRFNLTVL